MNNQKKVVKLISSKTGSPLMSIKTQRNEKCDCGSGKKRKNCCGVTHKYYDTGAKKITNNKEGM